MSYTLGEAAKATGKSKATISRAIKKGRISAARGETGEYSIDPSELHRVYPSASEQQNTQPVAQATHETDTIIQIKELEAQLKAAVKETGYLKEQIVDLREDRDKWRQQATALLTDQREKAQEKESAAQSTKIWAGLFIVVVIGLLVLAASFWPVLQNFVTG